MKVFEFIGMPRAGKTTQIERLKSYLEAQGSKVVVFTDRERAESIKTPPTEGLAYTLVFFTLAVEAYYRYRTDCDYLLIDRGFNDVAVWADVRFASGEISDQEADGLRQTFEKFKKLVDKTFYFDVSMETSLKRHARTEHQAVDDVAMNKVWLGKLQTAYNSNLSLFRNSVIIDGESEVEAIEQAIRNSL